MGLVTTLTEWRARRWLTALTDRLGREGLAVAASVPGLAASVDQHAAAVRDALGNDVDGAGLTDRVLLAAYGRGLLDRFDLSVDQVARSAGGRWCDADWLALRLLAVCALSRALPVRPSAWGAASGRSATRR